MVLGVRKVGWSLPCRNPVDEEPEEEEAPAAVNDGIVEDTNTNDGVLVVDTEQDDAFLCLHRDGLI